MTFAYLLVGAVLVFGIYWSTKYVLNSLEGSRERKQHSITNATESVPSANVSEYFSETSTLETVSVTEPNKCIIGTGYRFEARSGYCYKLSEERLRWAEGAEACADDGALLTRAFQRRQEQELARLFAADRDQPALWAAVGLKTIFARGYYFVYDYVSEKRLERKIRLRYGPDDAGKPQQYPFVDADLAMYWFSELFTSEFICEYKLDE